MLIFKAHSRKTKPTPNVLIVLVPRKQVHIYGNEIILYHKSYSVVSTFAHHMQNN